MRLGENTVTERIKRMMRGVGNRNIGVILEVLQVEDGG